MVLLHSRPDWIRRDNTEMTLDSALELDLLLGAPDETFAFSLILQELLIFPHTGNEPFNAGWSIFL